MEDKLRLALQAEEEFRKKFYENETKTLKEQSAVEVNIDSHKHSINLMLNLRKDFKIIMGDVVHPLYPKAMSDLSLRLKRKMRNSISAEETRARMGIRKIMKLRRRALYQLKCGKNAETTLSEIDFEHLTVENEIFENEMEEMNLSLKYLKQLSSTVL